MRILRAEEASYIDRETPKRWGIPLVWLMENAGAGLAAYVDAQLDNFTADNIIEEGVFTKTVLLVVGNGNNGADGLVAARHLAERGKSVVICLAGGREGGSELFQKQLGLIEQMGLLVWETLPEMTSLGLLGRSARGEETVLSWSCLKVLVEGLIGTGLRGALRAKTIEILRAMKQWQEQSHCKWIAIDLPAGIEADTGQVAVGAGEATATVTFGAPKQGMYLYPAASFCGEIVVKPLGIPWQTLLAMAQREGLQDGEKNLQALSGKVIGELGKQSTQLAGDVTIRIEEPWIRAHLPYRPKTAHKGMNGHTLIIGGQAEMLGAALMAAEGALRIGSGKTTLAVAKDYMPVLTGKVRPELMLGGLPSEGVAPSVLEGKQAVVIGPGGGRNSAMQARLLDVLQHYAGPLVIDADGLQALPAAVSAISTDRSADDMTKAKGEACPSLVKQKLGTALPFTEPSAFVGKWLQKRKLPIILTPHVGEFVTLSGLTAKEIECNRIEAARAFAKAWGVVLVLKGAPTVIAEPEGLVYVNSTGNEGMSIGGMGDVLSGIIGGLLAQGLAPLTAAALGVYLHGAAADQLAIECPWGYLPTEVAEKIPYLWQRYMTK